MYECGRPLEDRFRGSQICLEKDVHTWVRPTDLNSHHHVCYITLTLETCKHISWILPGVPLSMCSSVHVWFQLMDVPQVFAAGLLAVRMLGMQIGRSGDGKR